MTIRYRNLGAGRRISSIVFAGSHDASITSGSSSAQTQDLNIGQQAAAGVRFFDLRILAEGNKADGMSLKGYHGGAHKSHKITAHSSHTNAAHDIKYSTSMKYGTTGEKLSTMLEQAKTFVSATGEFLILKFDKCKNWDLIAQYCTSILGNTIYKAADGQEFGDLSLDELGGKVVCVFSESGLQEVAALGHRDGILGFRNLKGKNGVKPYEAGYPGLQYFGKGGTKTWRVWATNNMKMAENEKRQKKLMAKMANSDSENARNVLGMMYWTSTGTATSIRVRNANMWKNSGVKRMRDLWKNGLETSISHQLDAAEIAYVGNHEAGHRMRAFFPNIIMIDFADTSKCQTIYELNTIATSRLTQAYETYIREDG